MAGFESCTAGATAGGCGAPATSWPAALGEFVTAVTAVTAALGASFEVMDGGLVTRGGSVAVTRGGAMASAADTDGDAFEAASGAGAANTPNGG